MKEILGLGFKLLVICLISALLLGVANEATKEKIADVRAAANEKARKEVSPDADGFMLIEESVMNEVIAINPSVTEVFKAQKGDDVVGFVMKSEPNGYGGAVVVITGVDMDGIVTGVRIGSHQETPGLGGNATLPKFYEQYNGKNAVNGIGVSKTGSSETEIQAISGATISSQAVTDGVNYIGEIFDVLTK